MEPHPPSDSGNQSCYKLCGSVKDVAYGNVWKIFNSSDLSLGMNQNQGYSVGLVNGDKTV